MASAREMYLILRASNQASGALKRVARDVAGLGGSSGLKQRAQQLQITQDRLRQQRQLAQNELTSITNGRRAIANEKALASAALQTERAKLSQSGVDKAILANQEAQLKNQVTLRRLNATVGGSGFASLPAPIQSDYTKRLQAAEIASQRLALDEERLAERMNVAKGAITKQALALRELEAREIEADKRAQYLGSHISSLSSAIALQSQKIRDNNKAISDVKWDNLGRAGQAMQGLAKTAASIGAGVAVGLGVAAHSAAQFNTQVNLTATQVGNNLKQTVQDSKLLEKGILDLMASGNAFADSADENASAYDIFSSMTLKGNQRQQVTQGMALLKQFNRAAIAGQTDLKSVTEAGITILNDFSKQGNQVQDLPKMLNRMFASVRFGRTTVSEFVGALSQVAPAFSGAFGRSPHSFDQLSEAMAALTRHMPNVRMASAALARLTEMLGRKTFIEGMQKLGMPITTKAGSGVEHLKDLNVIIGEIAKKRPDLLKGGVALQNFYKDVTAIGAGNQGTMGTVQGRRALQFLLQNQKAYHDLSKQVLNDNDEFSKSFQALSDTSGVKWKEFTTQLHAFEIEIGEGVIPIIAKLAKPIERAIAAWNNLDDSTKNTIARFATYGAIFTILGSGVLFAVGTFVRLFAMMAKVTGGFTTLGGTVFAVVAAIQLLQGHWHDLNDVVNTFVNFGTGSLTGWAVMLTGAAAAALKLRGALVSVGAAQGASAGGGILSGLGGLLGGARNAGSTVKMVSGDIRNAEGASAKWGAALKGTAASAALIPGSVILAGGAIATAAAGALLWKMHMDGVKKTTDEVNAVNERNSKFYGQPLKSANQFSGLAGSVESVIKARAQLDQLRAAYNEAVKTMHKQPNATNQDAVSAAAVAMADGINQLNTANRNSNASFNAMSNSVVQYNRALGDLGNKAKHLGDLRNQLKELDREQTLDMSAGGTGGQYAKPIKDIQKQIDLLTGTTIPNAESSLAAAGSKLKTALRSNLSELSRAQIIPKLNPGDLSRLTATIGKYGQMPNIAQLKILINAQIDPKGLNKLPPQLRAAYKTVDEMISREAGRRSVVTIKPKIKVALEGNAAGSKNAFASGNALSALGGIEKQSITIGSRVASPKNTKAVQASVANFFDKNPSHQRVIVQAPAQAKLAAIGAQISQGIQSNVKVITEHVKAFYDAYITEHKKVAEIHSPSRLFAREIGQPIAEGIALGILQKSGDITKAAQATMELLNGAFLQARTSAISSYDPLNAKQKLAEAKKYQADIVKLQAKGGVNDPRVAKFNSEISAAMSQKQTASVRQHIKVLQQEENAYIKAAGAGNKYNAAQIKVYQAEIAKDLKAAKAPAPLNVGDLIKDTTQQGNAIKKFNSDLATLTKRHVPTALLDQLAALGQGGVKELTLLANATPAQLKKFVSAWQRAQKAVSQSARYTQTDIKTALKSMDSTAAQTLLSDWNSIHDSLQSQFGDLFNGLDDKIGTGLQSAIDTYNSSMDGFQKNIDDLNKQITTAQGDQANQIADAVTQATQDAIQTMQSNLGELFNGDWINGNVVQTNINWGQKLGFNDLFTDLQTQVTKFEHWQSDLTALAGKVPKALSDQLAGLGPSAVDQLDALNGATSDQLNQYVTIWQQGQNDIGGAANTLVSQSADLQKQIASISASSTSQISDLLNQISDVRAQMAALVKPVALNADDLQKWINDQIGSFGDWSDTITTLIDRGLPADLMKQLEAMGPQAEPYLKALNDMTDQQLFGSDGFVSKWQTAQDMINKATDTAMQTQLDIWYKYGSNAAAQIIAGVSSEQQPLIDYFTSLFKNLLTGQKPTVNTSGGSGVNNNNRVTDVSSGGGYGGSTGTTVNMTVNAQHTESLDTTLNRATFAIRTRGAVLED